EAAGADFVKTSTGFAPTGATVDDLRLMRRSVSPHIGVKAAHGVRTLDALLEVLEIGVTRVGATQTAAMLDEFKARKASPAPAASSSAAAAERKAIVCTKALARNGHEAADMVNLARDAGVMHAYAETEVFSPDVMRARQMIESGAIGDVLTVRAREAHSGPHAQHFWDAETAGGGALLDIGCHTV